jgi:hypothetical protein
MLPCESADKHYGDNVGGMLLALAATRATYLFHWPWTSDSIVMVMQSACLGRGALQQLMSHLTEMGGPEPPIMREPSPDRFGPPIFAVSARTLLVF